MCTRITHVDPARKAFLIKDEDEDEETFIFVIDGKAEDEGPWHDVGKVLKDGDFIDASTFLARCAGGLASFDPDDLIVPLDEETTRVIAGMEILFRAYHAWERSADGRRHTCEHAFAQAT